MANVVMFAALTGGFAFAITPAQDALRLLLGFGCVLLPLWGKNQKQGKIRLWMKVRISTVFGTGAVLLGSVVAVAFLRNWMRF